MAETQPSPDLTVQCHREGSLIHRNVPPSLAGYRERRRLEVGHVSRSARARGWEQRRMPTAAVCHQLGAPHGRTAQRLARHAAAGESALKFKPSQIARAASEISLKLASDARAAATVFTERAGGQLERASWFEAAGDVVDGISEKARYADLVIVGQYQWQGPLETHPLPIAHSLSLQCGRPVLVVPADLPSEAFDRVAIAWDGSREAVRAVHDALPFLRLARSVDIVEIVVRGPKTTARMPSSWLAIWRITRPQSSRMVPSSYGPRRT